MAAVGICESSLHSAYVHVLKLELVRRHSGLCVYHSFCIFTPISESLSWATATFPIAAFSERYKSRQPPFLLGLVLLIGSQIMFMEAPTYWVMILARVIQGFSSTIVWVVGLALLCVTYDLALFSTADRY